MCGGGKSLVSFLINKLGEECHRPARFLINKFGMFGGMTWQMKFHKISESVSRLVIYLGVVSKTPLGINPQFQLTFYANFF